jgi:hypothetical protein
LFGKGSSIFIFFGNNILLFSPIITLSWAQIVLHSNNVFEFSTIEPLRKQAIETDLQINDARTQNDSG